MADPKVETGHAAGFIVSEANGQRSRANVTLEGSAGALKAGEVLGVYTSGSDTGLYAKFNQDASDGRETAVAISINDVDDSSATQEIAVVARDAEVNADELVWPSDIEAAEQTTGEGELADVGIIVR